MNVITSPEIVLITKRRAITFTVSLKSLFLRSTKSPKPAFARSPLIAAPKVIEPFISIIVMPIEIAQFGISPISDATTG